jgi:hypothetical protein
MAFDVVAAKQNWCGTGSESEIGGKAGGERERQSEAVGGRYRLYPFAVSD